MLQDVCCTGRGLLASSQLLTLATAPDPPETAASKETAALAAKGITLSDADRQELINK